MEPTIKYFAPHPYNYGVYHRCDITHNCNAWLLLYPHKLNCSLFRPYNHYMEDTFKNIRSISKEVTKVM
jgi:hypothetical protein